MEGFKKYVIANGADHTQTLDAILDFLEGNSLIPLRPFDGSVQRLEVLIKKRMDTVEAKLTRIETNQA